jgi:glutathione-regulated potassium-efflux system ancillary protein KefG
MSDRSAEQLVLIVLAHPALEKSRVNRALADAVRDLDGVMLHDLYETWPEFDVHPGPEQRLLEAHDVVVLQHPFYWYSTPPLLKQWEDLVLEHGWAYGSDGTALHGKTLLSAVSAGGSEESYRPEGLNRYTMRQLLAPIEQTARLCGMRYPPPFVVHGTHGLEVAEIETHAADYRRVISALRDGTLDLDRAKELSRLNADLDALLGAGGR